MDDETILVKKIQIRRGTQAALEKKLVGDDKPLCGELIFELPSDGHAGGRVKVGDGINDYSGLYYLPDSVELNKYLSDTSASAAEAKASAAAASLSEESAANAMARAEEAAALAEQVPSKTMSQVDEYMNSKLHFMSMTEYNALDKLDTDGFYFITVED